VSLDLNPDNEWDAERQPPYPSLTAFDILPSNIREWQEWINPPSAPHMVSIFKDIVSFHDGKHHEVNDDPRSCTTLCRKIVIANWIAFMRRRYLNLLSASSLVSVSRSPTNYVNRTNWLNKDLDFPWQPGIFGNLINARFKLESLLKEVSGNMAALGLVQSTAHAYQKTGADGWEMRGWEEVTHWATHVVQMMNILTQAYQHTATIQEAQAANDLARSVAKITNLVIFLTPISVIAGFFSMAGDFSPAGSKSWVFWAVTCPVVSIISLAFFTNMVPFISDKLRKLFIRNEESGLKHQGI
jgi:hypothetical protein